MHVNSSPFARQVAETMRRNKALFGDLRMEDPPEGGNPPKEDPPNDGKQGGEKTLTQTEVNAIAAREKAAGKAAAEQELATSLGVSLDEAKAIIKSHRDKENAAKSEAEKAKEAADAEKAAAEAEKQTAKAEVHETRLERAFAKEGLPLDEAADDKRARVLRLVTVEVGAAYEDVLKDVQKVKEDFPELFGGKKSTEPPKRRAAGDPPGQPPAPAGGEDKFAKGRERAQRHGSGFRRVDPQQKTG